MKKNENLNLDGSECLQSLQPLGENLYFDTETHEKFIKKEILPGHEDYYSQIMSANHKNLGNVRYVFEDDNGKTYALREYIDGSTLRERLDFSPMTFRDTVEFSIKLCLGVRALHEKNIIHRDIKPENIIVTKSGDPVLIDFEISRDEFSFDREDERVCLTKGYAAPESFGFGEVKKTADIYSIGAVINECICGFLPSEKVTDTVLGIIVKKCTEFDPAKRYASVDELIRDLKNINIGKVPGVTFADKVVSLINDKRKLASAIAVVVVIALFICVQFTKAVGAQEVFITLGCILLEVVVPFFLLADPFSLQGRLADTSKKKAVRTACKIISAAGIIAGFYMWSTFTSGKI